MNNKEQQHIAELKENLNSAIRKKDIAGAIGAFAKKSVMFVLAPPLRFSTEDSAQGSNNLEQWFATFEGDIGLEYRELEILPGEEVEFCYCLEHLTGKRTNGTTTDMWYRETLGLQKVAGLWKIIHQHQSVPLYMDGSDKAAIDLKP